MKILVCGGRDFNDYNAVKHVLDDLKPGCIVSGMARGADTLAARWARNNNVRLLEYPADWKRYGRSAGFRRNRQMLDSEHPHLVVAFPGGRGTRHMVSYARSRNVPVKDLETAS